MKNNCDLLRVAVKLKFRVKMDTNSPWKHYLRLRRRMQSSMVVENGRWRAPMEFRIEDRLLSSRKSVARSLINYSKVRVIMKYYMQHKRLKELGLPKFSMTIPYSLNSHVILMTCLSKTVTLWATKKPSIYKY